MHVVGTLPPFSNVNAMNIQRTVSERDSKILEIVGLRHRFTPYSITGDGNCLFNAVATLLWGNEENWKLVKAKTAQFFANNHERLRGGRYGDLEVFFESDLETMKSCAVDGCWSNTLTMVAIANALNLTINSVYPPLNGVDDLVYRTVNTTIQPISENGIAAEKTISIMWTGPYDVEAHSSGLSESTRRTFVPNHFVALLDCCENGRRERPVLESVTVDEKNLPPVRKRSKIDETNDLCARNYSILLSSPRNECPNQCRLPPDIWDQCDAVSIPFRTTNHSRSKYTYISRKSIANFYARPS